MCICSHEAGHSLTEAHLPSQVTTFVQLLPALARTVHTLASAATEIFIAEGGRGDSKFLVRPATSRTLPGAACSLMYNSWCDLQPFVGASSV